MSHFVRGHPGEAAEPGAPERDRPGRGASRLRLRDRGPETGRADARGHGSRAAPARDARRARTDVREVRPAPLHAPRRRPARHHHRAALPPGRRAAVSVRGRGARDPRRARPAARAALHRVRGGSARGRLDRPGAPRGASERASRRREGPAAERAAADRGRPLAHVSGGTPCEGADPGARLHRRARARRRVRAVDPAGARLPARGAQRRHVPQGFRGPSARDDPARLLDLHALTHPDPRRARGDPARGHRRRALVARAATAPRVPDHRGVDDDDLPQRVLPRRPASGEHPRARARPARARRLRPDGEADRRRHVAADAPVHRRSLRERGDAAETARRPRRPLPEGARGAVRLGAARALLPLLRREPAGDRPDPGDPGGVLAHLPHEPAAAHEVRDARQGDRHAGVGGRRALPGLQRLRGREAVRARSDAGALHAAADRRRARGARAGG